MDKHNYDVKLSKHELEEETEERKRMKKIMKSVLGVIAVLMMLSFIVPNDVLGSLIESRTLSNSTIKTSAAKVLFKPEVLDELQNYYKENQMTEFKLCLTGFIREGAYYVTGFYEPKILFQTPISIHSEVCNSSSIIDLHSHPLRNCLFSQQDVLSYKQGKDILGGVMCDVDRFNFYKN